MEYTIWGAEENWLINHLNQSLNIRMKVSQKDIEAFFSSREDLKPADLLTIEGDVAKIPIYGYLTNKLDWYDMRYGGATSYPQIIDAAERATENSQVKEIKLLLDTPGGLVKGLDNAWKILMKCRKKKKMTAVCEGLMASAGYYLASAANEIHSTSETNEIGSIGVMVAGIDWTKHDEKLGIKEVVIVSKNAPDKNADVSTEKGRTVLQKRVDTYEQFFLSRIAEGRGLDQEYVAENFGRGGLLVSQSPDTEEADALSVGMIDKVLNIAKDDDKSKSIAMNANTKEENFMTLAEFLAANPDAQAEIDRQLASKYQSGVKDGKQQGEEAATGRIKQAFNVLGKDSVYAGVKPIQDAAMKVIEGESDIIVLQSAVASWDAVQEGMKSQKAKDETDEAGETPPQQSNKSSDGIVRTEEDLNSLAAKLGGKQ